MHDTIIVGGSYAGISAGLRLVRARRDVLVLDAGQRRNLTATTSHGFLGLVIWSASPSGSRHACFR